MALKDWTKNRNGFTSKNAPHPKEIKIIWRKDFIGKPFIVVVDSLINNMRFETEYFQTKSQALRFAKKYMRSH